MKKVHFGQVVPIEEIEQIFGFVNSIVRMACICRHTTLGEEKRYCYGISLAPDGGMFAEILRGVDTSFFIGRIQPDLRRSPRTKPSLHFARMSKRASAIQCGPSTRLSSAEYAIATVRTALPCAAPSRTQFPLCFEEYVAEVNQLPSRCCAAGVRASLPSLAPSPYRLKQRRHIN